MVVRDFDIITVERANKERDMSDANNLAVFCREREKPFNKVIFLYNNDEFTPYIYVKKGDHNRALKETENYDELEHSLARKHFHELKSKYEKLTKEKVKDKKEDEEEAPIVEELPEGTEEELAEQKAFAKVVLLEAQKEFDYYEALNFFMGNGSFIKETKFIYLKVPNPVIGAPEQGSWYNFAKEPLERLNVCFPDVVPDLRKHFEALGIETYESNILFDKRFRYDLKLRASFKYEGPLRALYTFNGIPRYEALCKHTKPLNEPWMIEERVHIFDIETPAESFTEPRDATAPIGCLGCYDYYLGKFFSWFFRADYEYNEEETTFTSKLDGTTKPWQKRYFQSEAVMIQNYINFIRETSPDIISGWNSSKWDTKHAQQQPYDMPYLLKRLKLLKLQSGELSEIGQAYSTKMLTTIVKGREIVDMMEMYEQQKRSGIKRLDLESVVKQELDKQLGKEPEKILKWYQEDPEKLIYYNITDVDACRCLNDHIGLLQLIVNFKVENGGNISDIVSPVRLHDNFLFYHKKDPNLVFPIPKGERGRRIKGAKVVDPEPSLIYWVSVIDESRLYPSIFLSGNISYETYCDPKNLKKIKGRKITFPSGHTFVQEPEGVIAANIRTMLEFRGETEQKLKNAKNHRERDLYKRRIMFIKVLTNSIYGVLNNPYFRLYRLEASETVTDMGQKLLILVIDTTTGMGYVVCFGDTDSCGVHFGKQDKIIEKTEELITKIQLGYDKFAKQLGIVNHHFKIKHEKVFASLLFAGQITGKSKKKRYAGYVVWEGGRWLEEKEKYIHVAGFESKRSNSSDITTEVQTKTFEDLLIHNKKSRYVFNYWVKMYQQICSGKLPIIKCVPSPSLSKSPEDYERNTVHAVAAKYSNNNLPSVGKFHRGDRVYYVYVKSVPEGFPETATIGLKADSELPEGFEPDWEKIADKAIKNVFIKLSASLKIPIEDYKTMGES